MLVSMIQNFRLFEFPFLLRTPKQIGILYVQLGLCTHSDRASYYGIDHGCHVFPHESTKPCSRGQTALIPKAMTAKYNGLQLYNHGMFQEGNLYPN